MLVFGYATLFKVISVPLLASGLILRFEIYQGDVNFEQLRPEHTPNDCAANNHPFSPPFNRLPDTSAANHLNSRPCHRLSHILCQLYKHGDRPLYPDIFHAFKS